MNNADLKTLIHKQKLNFSLDQEFYVNQDIFDLDIKNIFSKQWVFVGHTSRIPKHGDFFLFNIGKESIIIIRDKDNKIYAHYNVCRHRGSHICLEESGNNNNDWARDAIETQDGNFVVTGTWNDDGWNSKASLRKYGTNGELLWAKNYNNSTANEAYELIETDEGDLVFAGYSGTQHGFYKWYMVKTDADGNQIWKKANNSTGDAILYGLCKSPDGSYAAAGFCNSWRSNYLVERNASGGALWNDCHIVEPTVSGYHDIIPSSNGGYYVIDGSSNFKWVNNQGELVFSQNIGHVNMSIMELENGDIVVGGYGFIDGNSGGIPALLKMSFSN